MFNCSANQLAGFYMMVTLAFNELKVIEGLASQQKVARVVKWKQNLKHFLLHASNKELYGWKLVQPYSHTYNVILSPEFS